MRIIIVLLALLPVSSMAQRVKKADKQLAQNLQNHIQFLASDALEGRRAGSPGEQKAVDYIVAQYQALKLTPMGEQGFVQSFPIAEGKRFSSNAFIKVNNSSLELTKDFFPLSNSGSATIQSRAAITLNEAKQVWFKDLQEVLEENASNPHFDINAWVVTKSEELVKKGATALFLHNSGTVVDNIQYNKFDTAAALKIPIIYFTKEGWTKCFKDELETYAINANIQFEQTSRIAHNVAAFIDNHAANTVIIGAHLDHLGYNEDHNALDINNDIRNGADDNASGTAALMELAKALVKKSPKNNNYLILHFSGEELGLFGSKYWLEHPTFKGNFNYMINLDMVGRYDTAHKLSVGGYGTSSKWAEILGNTKTSLLTHYDSAGSGPSDHASFYRKDMPVLFMFTGSHSDYHKASDDWDKINYKDESNVIRYVQAIIQKTDGYGKLDFLKTRETSMGKSTKFKVTLGVMPDYAFTGTGVRIDGVSPNKVGEKLGLKAGDVLVQVGPYKLVDVIGYMDVLSKFNKGDKTTLIIRRGTEEIKYDFQFQ